MRFKGILMGSTAFGEGLGRKGPTRGTRGSPKKEYLLGFGQPGLFRSQIGNRRSFGIKNLGLTHGLIVFKLGFLRQFSIGVEILP